MDGLTDVVIAAVQDSLVCSKAFADPRQGLDDPKPQPLALLALIHRDIFDVSNGAQAPQEFLLHEHSPSGNHLVIGLRYYDDGEIRLVGFETLACTCTCRGGRRAE